MPALMFRRASVIGICAALTLGFGAATASADYEDGGGESDGDVIGSHVEFEYSSPGSGGQPMTSSDTSWTPPPCWYEPNWKAVDFEEWLRQHDYGGGSAGTDIRGEYGEETNWKFHKGEEGAWYQLMDDQGRVDSDEWWDTCEPMREYEWIGEADPAPADWPVIDPETLAGLAYDRMRLPAPPLELKPDADRQIVNLETLATFSDQLEPEWVTASLNNLGINVAATTVATPTELHLEAGTEDADPDSCLYDLVLRNGSYQVDTEDAGCNITYRKSSGDGTYDMQASITWDVTWNPTASPDGEPVNDDLPDGESTNEIPVTVKEIQTVVR